MSVADPHRWETPDLLIHCQYVYGIGHFVRTIELARSLSQSFNVTILNGGEEIPHYRLPPKVKCVQLSAIYKHEQDASLLPVDPSQDLDACFSSRLSLIKQELSHIAPVILITEHFPFGLLFEAEVVALIGLVKQANHNTRIVCSVRDVIESPEGGKHDDHTCKLLNDYYDAVLVHGDERVVPFSASFPLVDLIRVPIINTGYIVKNIPEGGPAPLLPNILVSIGGGRMGDELLYATIDAYKMVVKKWRHRLIIFTGAFQKDVQHLLHFVGDDEHELLSIHNFDEQHYCEALSVASGIICLGGYNTLLEAISVRLPVLVYARKFLGNNEEQSLRLQFFERYGLVRVLRPDDLEIERLTARILDFREHTKESDVIVKVDGAEVTRRILVEMLSDAASGPFSPPL
jgi:predicted glycosyltransferase